MKCSKWRSKAVTFLYIADIFKFSCNLSPIQGLIINSKIRCCADALVVVWTRCLSSGSFAGAYNLFAAVLLLSNRTATTLLVVRPHSSYAAALRLIWTQAPMLGHIVKFEHKGSLYIHFYTFHRL